MIPRVRFTVALMSILASLAIAGGADAQASRFVGAWKLVSFVGPDATGATQPRWGPNPPGLIVYMSDGTMAAQLYDDRRKIAEALPAARDTTSARTVLDGMASYFGTFTVDTAKRLVTHHVEGAYRPEWAGHDLVRSYRFLGANRLELRVVVNADGKPVANGGVLTWERIRR